MKILVIRRDNIGDLVCTLPLIRALRMYFPHAWIGALVNSYNRDVLQGNQDLDEVFSYTKAKHLAPGNSVLANYWQRVRLIAKLRRKNLDYVVLAGAIFLPRVLRLASWVKPRHIIGYADQRSPHASKIDMPLNLGDKDNLHEVEYVFRLLAPLGIEGQIPTAHVFPDAALRARFADSIPFSFADGPLIGLHISARKPSNRWPVERFVQLAQQLHETYGAHFLLFWSPGASEDSFHPGDDDKARSIIDALGPELLSPLRTTQLTELIAGLSLCDYVVCSDGGAMHIAAALEKPIVCLFGGTDPFRWHPWAVPHVLLQDASREVMALTVEEVVKAADKLIGRRPG